MDCFTVESTGASPHPLSNREHPPLVAESSLSGRSTSRNAVSLLSGDCASRFQL